MWYKALWPYSGIGKCGEYSSAEVSVLTPSTHFVTPLYIVPPFCGGGGEEPKEGQPLDLCGVSPEKSDL